MSIDIKLQGIYKSLVEGEFITKFEALSLSGIDVDKSPADSPSSPAEPVVLRGLVKLTEEIEKNLISEGISEQAVLLRINNELSECERAVQNDIIYKFMHAPEREDAETPEWQKLPAGDDGLSSEERKIRLNGLRSRLHDLHAEITNQLGTKCYVYKKVHGIYEAYLSRLTALATSSAVLHPSVRAKLVVDAQMNRILSNKFLSTTVLNEAKKKTVQLLADLIFYGKEGLEYADHQLTFKSVLQLNSRKTNFLDFGVSFRVGCVCMLLIWAAFEVLVNELHGMETWLDPSFTIFICIGLFIVLLWCWGGCLYIWRNAGINFIRVLNLEHTSLASVRRPEDLVFRSATDLTLVYLIVFIMFNSAKTRVFASDANPWIAHSLPVALLVFFLYRMCSPWRKDRKIWFSMITSMGQSMSVTFRDGYVADILTSLVRVYLSIFFAFSYTICLAYFAFSSDPGAISTVHLSEIDQAVRNNAYFRHVLLPIITLLPLKIRLVQCLLRAIETGNRWPHFGNALKYASCAVVVAQGLFNREVQHETSWLVCLFLVTMYQFAWDVVMDWGLISMSRDGSFRIRSNRYVGSNWIYYVAIIVNLLLRFAWVLTLIQLDVTNTEKDMGERRDRYVFVFDYLHPVAACLEIMRRMMWGIFRVEFEDIESTASPMPCGLSGEEDLLNDSVDAGKTSLTKFEKMEMSVMADEAAVARAQKRSRPVLSDGIVECLSFHIYDWAEFFMSCFGVSSQPENSEESEEGYSSAEYAARKQRISESIIFVFVLAVFLTASTIFI